MCTEHSRFFVLPRVYARKPLGCDMVWWGQMSICRLLVYSEGCNTTDLLLTLTHHSKGVWIWLNCTASLCLIPSFVKKWMGRLKVIRKWAHPHYVLRVGFLWLLQEYIFFPIESLIKPASHYLTRLAGQRDTGIPLYLLFQ